MKKFAIVIALILGLLSAVSNESYATPNATPDDIKYAYEHSIPIEFTDVPTLDKNISAMIEIYKLKMNELPHKDDVDFTPVSPEAYRDMMFNKYYEKATR